jgi:hypothetical protein
MKMKRYCLPVLALIALLLVGLASQDANAQGCYSGFYGGYGHGGHGYGSYWGGGWGAHSWHDTTHLDYHPGSFVPHYDHFDYVPGHFDIHRSGHWHHNHF